MCLDLVAANQFNWRSVHNQMIMHCSIAQNTLSGLSHHLNPSSYCMFLFFWGGGEVRLEKVQKINLEQAKSITVFSHPAASSTSCFYQPYVGQGRRYRRGSSSKEGTRKEDKPAASATATEPSKDSQVLTITVPQVSTKRQVDILANSPHQRHTT